MGESFAEDEDGGMYTVYRLRRSDSYGVAHVPEAMRPFEHVRHLRGFYRTMARAKVVAQKDARRRKRRP